MMTKKDYEVIATGFAESTPPLTHEDYSSWLYAAQCVADALEDNNPKFDRDRFLAACGVQP